MAKDEYNDKSSKKLPAEEIPLRGSFEIPTAVHELLQRSAVPPEFLEIVRKTKPRLKTTSFSIEPEDYPTPSEDEMPFIEEPMPEEPVEPELEVHFEPRSKEAPETGRGMLIEPDWEEAPLTVPEVFHDPSENGHEKGCAEMFYLTDLKIDLSCISHKTQDILQWEETSLGHIVTDTYPVCFDGDQNEDGVFEEEPGGQGEEIGEEPPCVYCKLILIYGKSVNQLVVKKLGSKKEVVDEPTDVPIQTAHNAAARYYDAKAKGKKEKCVIVIHVGWKKGENIGESYRYSGEKTKTGGDKWDLASNTAKIEEWLSKDPKDRSIDCFSEVLVIYHGETQRTRKVLKWLGTYCKAPIKNLYLWSCFGSEKVDLNSKNVKKALAGIDHTKVMEVKDLEEEIEDLEEALEDLEEEIEELEEETRDKSNGKLDSKQRKLKRRKRKLKDSEDELAERESELEELNTELMPVMKHIEQCDCALCLYIASPLETNKETVIKRIKTEIAQREQRLIEKKGESEALRSIGGLREAQNNADRAAREAKKAYDDAKDALKEVEKGSLDNFPMPLGIQQPTEDAPLILLAPQTTMRRYCPLKLDDPKPKDVEINQIFEDIPVRADTDLIVKGLLR